MADEWWELPGNDSFVERLIDDLLAGKNLCICLPQHVPLGLDAQVRRRVEDEQMGFWMEIQADDSPAEALSRNLALKIPSGTLINAAMLAADESFGGRVLWVHGVSAPMWPTWRDFLVDYQHACRNVDPLDRTVIVVTLLGLMADTPPPSDVCLAVHRYDDVVDLSDAYLYAWRSQRNRSGNRIHRKIRAAVISQLGMWDPGIRAELENADLRTVLSPSDVLSQLAVRRSWECNVGACWHNGTLHTFEGHEYMHSAYCALQRDVDEIRSRIWTAQVTVLLPFIEEQRRQIVLSLGHKLRVPFEDRDGRVVNRIEDLEIGHIYSQVAACSSFDSAVYDVVGFLRYMRNELLHLNALSYSTLCDPRFYRLLDRRAPY